jgi:hypothetical protein
MRPARGEVAPGFRARGSARFACSGAGSGHVELNAVRHAVATARTSERVQMHPSRLHGTTDPDEGRTDAVLAELKAKLVLEALRGELTAAQLAADPPPSTGPGQNLGIRGNVGCADSALGRHAAVTQGCLC